MKRYAIVCNLLALCAAIPGVAPAQAMIENALSVGRAANSTAPMQGLNKSIGGAFGSLEKTLKKSLNGTDFQVEAPPKPVETARAASVTAPAVHYEDPKEIATGTAYDELVRRFGPAALEITTGPVSKTMSYMTREGAFQVELRDGVVSSVAAVRR